MDGLGGVVLFYALLLLPAIIAGIIAGVLAFVRWRARRVRRLSVQSAANDLGFELVPRHPVAGVPFAIRRRGDGQGSGNFMTGRYRGRDVVVFDAWYWSKVTEGKIPIKRYSWFTCAVIQIDVAWPHLRIERETVATRAIDRIGLADLQFESDEFNRTFEVNLGMGPGVIEKTFSFGFGGGRRRFTPALEALTAQRPIPAVTSPEARRFASALIDPSMMQWLLTTRSSHAFEIFGSHIMCYSAQTSEIRPLIESVLAFHERIPAVVYELFSGSPQPDADVSGSVVEGRIDLVHPDLSTPLQQALFDLPGPPVQPAIDAMDVSNVARLGAARPDDLPRIAPEELPLRPDDPRIAILRERMGADALRAAGLL